MFRFDFKGKDAKEFRIETPWRVIHKLKGVSQEITAAQKEFIKTAIVQIIKRSGTSPPRKPKNEFLNCVREQLQSVCPVTTEVCFRRDALAPFYLRFADFVKGI
jgi:hypothetical protein